MLPRFPHFPARSSATVATEPLAATTLRSPTSIRLYRSTPTTLLVATLKSSYL